MKLKLKSAVAGIILMLICLNAQCTDYNLYLFRVFQNPQNVLWGFQFENDWVYLKMVETNTGSETGYDLMDDNDRKNFPKLAEIYTGMKGINFRDKSGNAYKLEAIKNIQEWFDVVTPDGIWGLSLNQKLINIKKDKYEYSSINKVFEKNTVSIYNVTDMLHDPIGYNWKRISAFGYGLNEEAKASEFIGMVKNSGSVLPPPFKSPFDDAMKSYIPNLQLMANKEYINDYLNKDKFPDGLRQYFMEKNSIELSQNVTVKGKGWFMRFISPTGTVAKQWRIVDNDNKKEYNVKKVGDNNLTIEPYHSIWKKIIIIIVGVVVTAAIGVVIYLLYRFRHKISNVIHKIRNVIQRLVANWKKRKQPQLVGDFNGKLPGEEPKPEPSGYAIKVGDKVVITLWSGMNTNLLCDQRVGKKKQITLLDKRIEVAGLTALKLEEKIRTELSQELNRKQTDTVKVNVNDKEFLVLKMTPNLKPETVKEPETGKYYIKNGDTLNIAVRKGDAVPTESTVVAKDGYIEYGNINFNVYNLTTDEVSARILKYVKQRITDANVQVIVSVVQAGDVKKEDQPAIEEEHEVVTDEKDIEKEIEEDRTKISGTDRILAENREKDEDIRKLKEENNKLQETVKNTQEENGKKDEDIRKLKEENNKLQETVENTQEGLKTKILEAESRLPLNKIRELLDFINREVGGNWYDNAKKHIPMLSDNSTKQISKSNNYTLDEIKKLIDELDTAASESAKPPDSDTRKVLQSIGRDVVPSVLETIDQKKSAGINMNHSLEEKLSELMKLTEVREMDIKVGEVYDSQIHDLVADDDPSKKTDPNQRITKVLFRGLLLPGGGHIKPRVSIRK